MTREITVGDMHKYMESHPITCPYTGKLCAFGACPNYATLVAAEWVSRVSGDKVEPNNLVQRDCRPQTKERVSHHHSPV